MTDLASLDFIRRALVRGDIFNYPFQLSYYYPDPTVILYHIARLWSVLPTAGRYLPQQEIVAALRKRLRETEGELIPSLMLSSALLKLGQKSPRLNYNIGQLERAAQSFPFFIAPMLAGTRSRLLNKLAEQRAFQVDYRCEAYFFTLAIEYEILQLRHKTRG